MDTMQMSPRAVKQSPRGGALRGQDVPRDFVKLLQGLRIPNPEAIFGDFVKEIQSVIYIMDTELDECNRVSRSGYIGVCCGGICLLRLSMVLATLLNSPTPAPQWREYLEDPSNTDFLGVLRRLLQAALASGSQGLVGLSLISMHTKAMVFLADLIRSHCRHPSRAALVELEGDPEAQVTPPRTSKLEKRLGRGHGQSMLTALDAMMCSNLTQEEFLLDIALLRRAPLTVQPGAAPAAPPPIQDEADVLEEALEAVWEQFDLDEDHRLSVSEACELVRLALSRPVFGILVRARLVPLREVDDQPTEALQEENVQRLAALWAAHKAVSTLALSVTEISTSLWEMMDSNGNEVVSKDEFIDTFPDALQHLVELATEEAARRLPEFLDMVRSSQAEANPPETARSSLETGRSSRDSARSAHFQGAADAAALLEPSSRTFPQLPAQSGPVAIQAGAPAEEEVPQRSMRSPCTAEWLFDWMGAAKRNCAI